MKARLLKSSEVAAIFRVSPRTISRWAAAGKIRYTQTPGGQRRYWLAEIEENMKWSKNAE